MDCSPKSRRMHGSIEKFRPGQTGGKMQADGKKQTVDYRPDFLSQYISFYKQLLDEVFVIS